MKNAQNGSMLLEALIALSITSFLVFSIANITSNTSQSLNAITTIGQQQQKIIAVSNQLERDLSALVVIPTKQPADEKDADKTTPDAKKKKTTRALIGQADLNDVVKIEKKDFPTFKVLNGLTTSPLESYGENKPHLVRFTYKLIKQTLKAPLHKTRAFKLYRRETTNLDDLNVKQENEVRDSQFATSSEWVLICDNISDVFVRYHTYAQSTPPPQAATGKPAENAAQPEAPAKDAKASPPEPINSFTWPINKLGEEYKQRVPHSIHVILRLWNSEFTRTLDYQFIIPCMAYAGTLPEHLIEAKEPEKPNTPGTPDAPKAGTPSGTQGAPGAVPGSPGPAVPPPPQPSPASSDGGQAPGNFGPQPSPAPQPSQGGGPVIPQQAAPGAQLPQNSYPPEHHYTPEEHAANEAFFSKYPPEVIAHMPADQIMKVMPPALQKEVQEHIKEMQRDPLKYIQNVMEMLSHEH